MDPPAAVAPPRNQRTYRPKKCTPTGSQVDAMSNSESKREQLQQIRMPVMDWEFTGSTIQSLSYNYLPLPQFVCWEEFDVIQDEFLASMESEFSTSLPLSIRIICQNGRRVKTEVEVTHIYANFMSAVFDFLGHKCTDYLGFTIPWRNEAKRKRSGSNEICALAGPLTRYLDILYCRGKQSSEPIIVVELKRVNFFRDNCEESLPDLFAIGDFNVSLRQVHTYMAYSKTGYGVLSSGDLSFFLKWEATNNGKSVLKISKGILWDDLLIPMAAFCQTAFLDKYKYQDEPEQFDDLTPSDGQNEGPSLEKDNATDKDYKYFNISEDLGPFTMTTRSKASTSNMNITNSSLAIDTKPFASGSGGNIFLGKVNGCKVAVKLTLCETSEAKMLQNEVVMYEKLKAYWGQCVPALLSYGTLGEGKVAYLATEFVESSELGKEVVTSTVMEAAVTALQIIHSCSILHRDVSERNILVVDHGQGGVYFIDFGLSRLTSNKKELQREMAKLKYLLESLMASGNGKANRLDNHITQSASRA